MDYSELEQVQGRNPMPFAKPLTKGEHTMPKTSSPLTRPFRYAVTAGFFLLVTAGRLSAQAANLLPNPGFEQD